MHSICRFASLNSASSCLYHELLEGSDLITVFVLQLNHIALQKEGRAMRVFAKIIGDNPTFTR